MPIDYSLGEALRLFLEHLKQAGVTQSALTVYARALHGRFLAELIVLAPGPPRMPHCTLSAARSHDHPPWRRSSRRKVLKYDRTDEFELLTQRPGGLRASAFPSTTTPCPVRRTHNRYSH